MSENAPVQQTRVRRGRRRALGPLSASLACGGVLLASILAAGAWAEHEKRNDRATARALEANAAAAIVGQAIEPLVASGEWSTVRRLIADAALRFDLRECRLTAAGGIVVAHSDPTQITVPDPGTLRVGVLPSDPGEPEPGSFYVRVPGMPLLTLETVASPSEAAGGPSLGFAGIAAAGALGLGLTVVLVGRSWRGLLAIRGALRAFAHGERARVGLMVAERFGHEASAWNRIIDERSSLEAAAVEARSVGAIRGRGDSGADLDTLMDALWHGVLVVDQELQVKYINGAATVLLGAKREELVGNDLVRFLSDPGSVEVIRSVVSGAVRRRASVEYSRAVGGVSATLRLSVRPVKRDDAPAALVLIEDVTQQRVADQARNSYVAQATHELRTPLTNIRLYVEQAVDEGEKDPSVRANCLNVISQEARRLERIVGDMLSIAEMEVGSLRLRSGDVRVDAIVDELKHDFSPQAAEAGVELRFDIAPKLPVLVGDRDKIVLAIHNLVGNAIKYTPRGGRVEVRVGGDERQLSVDVADTGIGIAPEEREKIFDRFYRANDKRIETITGTGLGLALAREVARMHGGDIAVHSELNKGSTFTLTVPTLAKAA